MANQFINLPVPAPLGNGSGAAMDVSGLAALKAVICSGDCVGQINVEVNNDAGQAGSWQTVASFQNKGYASVVVAAKWMRVTIAGYKRGTPQIDIGAAPGTTTFASLPTPTSTSGSGAAVDVSAAGVFKTIHVGGAFRGAAVIEVSEDGVTNWAQVASFNNPGVTSASFVAKWMRCARTGVPAISPGQPLVTVGSTNDTGGGGGAAVVHDGTLTGTGLSGDPLGVVPSALDDQVAVVADGTTITGTGVTGNALAVRPAGLAGQVAVATDGSLTGSGTTGNPLSVVGSVDKNPSATMTNDNVATVPIGAPVYVSAAGHFDLAKADAAATATCIGILAAAVNSGAAGQVWLMGVASLTTVQWDAICGTVGGLTAKTYYYLSDTVAGQLTSAAPSTPGHYSQPIIYALSATVAKLNPGPSIQL